MHPRGFIAQMSALTTLSAFYAPITAATWPVIATRTPELGDDDAEEWTFAVLREGAYTPATPEPDREREEEEEVAV